MDFHVIEQGMLPRAAHAYLMLLPDAPRFGAVFLEIQDEPGPFDSAAAALNWLKDDHETLREALVAAAHHRDDLVAQLAETLWALFLHHRQLVPPTVFADGAAAAARSACIADDPEHARRHRLGQANLLLKEIAARVKLGDVDTAETLLPEATALADRLASPMLQATAHAQRGHLAHTRGSLTEALDSLRTALQLEEHGGTRRGASMRHRALSLILRDLCLYDQAEIHLFLARDLLAATGDAKDQARISEFLGTLYSLTGRHDDAVTELTRALTVFGELGSHYQATCHHQLALALERRAAANLQAGQPHGDIETNREKTGQDRRRAALHRSRARELSPGLHTGTVPAV
ncbi:tetratricopeptide (TPR) repeat protein [Actinoalloteichus hoggarensis]|uniref:Uncharacterized protein n=1 Tax=Actinoalloteichus hoggarensis TaxID=1470176 RepID=A0A221W6G9_9PSEU|nr:hypothetical protein [Actinoalloteichus hoggarensis]ASO21560.1 hypothetical protein AHOG_19710 [Actinoalloteichus hoggarensis]MBB5922152.1 tetratricopeptide (TPR) repeat protein [Actinoalloteichus hoggarensis]